MIPGNAWFGQTFVGLAAISAALFPSYLSAGGQFLVDRDRKLLDLVQKGLIQQVGSEDPISNPSPVTDNTQKYIITANPGVAGYPNGAIVSAQTLWPFAGDTDRASFGARLVTAGELLVYSGSSPTDPRPPSAFQKTGQ
jgi:hypothetical protein